MGIFAEALIAGEDIKDYIPQREPIIMVDAFYGLDDKKSFSGFKVKEDSIFVDDEHLIDAGIIEHIAQSCALRIGYLFRQQQLPIPTGFIGAIKNMKIRTLPKVGQQLFTTITVLTEIFDITLVSIEVEVNQTTVATGEMKIFLNSKHEENNNDSVFDPQHPM